MDTHIDQVAMMVDPVEFATTGKSKEYADYLHKEITRSDITGQEVHDIYKHWAETYDEVGIT